MLTFPFSLPGPAAPPQPGPALAPPRLEAEAIIAADGQRLPLRRWSPEEDHTRGVILALHGMNDYSHAFEGAGRHLAARGFALYAYDQRGFGAGPWPGHWPGERALVEDAAAALGLLAARHPGLPLYLLGESMGGAIALLTAETKTLPPLAGLILSAAAVWSRHDMGLMERGLLWLSSHSLPWLTLSGHGLHLTPSDNFDMLRELTLDPLVIKETRIDTIHGVVELMTRARQAARHLRHPALLLYGEKDEIIPAAATFQMMRALPGPGRRQRCALYPRGHHMLLRDLQAATVLDDIAAWLQDPARPLPSGADHYAERVIFREPGP
ncbi:alpha/beta hydrolase family protein [mine drainage metagenome]|uniref:Alpha/beta hydrolase family protein n=1 Tax=mine drainage metagenome TaxID=410659 RepID=A0A1J5SHQ7_9ZZZZ